MLDTGKVTRTRVVIADDHRLTAHAIADSLTGRGFDVVGVSYGVPDALDLVTRHQPDLLISDLDMGPGPTGADLIVRVAAHFPRMGLVLLTAYEDPKLLAPGMPTLPARVVYRVKHQLSDLGELEAAAVMALDYASGAIRPMRNGHREPLTEPQANLLRLIAQGLSNQAISEELSLSPDSVAKSINRLAKRLGVTKTESTNVRVALSQKYFDYIGFQREN
ncbi:MAG: response regulator transcription factor [Pontimonas sp.]